MVGPHHIPIITRINNILSLIISPAIGGLIIAMICLLLKSIISNLYVKTIICVLGGVIVYGLLVMVMKNEFACQLIDSIKRRFDGEWSCVL